MVSVTAMTTHGACVFAAVPKFYTRWKARTGIFWSHPTTSVPARDNDALSGPALRTGPHKSTWRPIRFGYYYASPRGLTACPHRAKVESRRTEDIRTDTEAPFALVILCTNVVIIAGASPADSCVIAPQQRVAGIRGAVVAIAAVYDRSWRTFTRRTMVILGADISIRIARGAIERAPDVEAALGWATTVVCASIVVFTLLVYRFVLTITRGGLAAI